MAIRPSTDGGFDGEVVPKGKQLALLLQLVIQSFLANPFYGLFRPERLRCQSGHQHERVLQRARPNPLHLRQHYCLFIGAMENEEAVAEGLNLVPVLLCLKRSSSPATPFGAVLGGAAG